MSTLLRILALCNNDGDTEKLFKTLRKQTLLTCAWNLPELKVLLKGGQYDLFLCVEDFAGGTWRDALVQVRQLRPQLPVVIFSSEPTFNWAAAIEAGAADVITKTISDDVLISTLAKIAPKFVKRAAN
jgi:CheY-like chemotaxis protein